MNNKIKIYFIYLLYIVNFIVHQYNNKIFIYLLLFNIRTYLFKL